MNIFYWKYKTIAILFLPMTAMKGLISAPFAALGFLGNNIRMGCFRTIKGDEI